jgi:hypothetical protein
MGIHAHGVRAADRLAFRPGLLAEWTRRPEAKALTLRSRVQRHKCLCSLRTVQARPNFTCSQRNDTIG